MIKKIGKGIFEFFLVPILIAAVILIFRSNVFDYSLVSGESMLPTLENNQTLVLDRLDKSPERGDVINFYSKENNPTATKGHDVYVKRVIGVPGDTIELKSGYLYVNGKEVNQDFLALDNPKIDGEKEAIYGTQYPVNKDWDLKTLSTEVPTWNSFSKNTERVPEGCYFVMGDHRSNSTDSRFFGYVKGSSILGVVKPNPISRKKSDYFLTEKYTNRFFKE